MLVTASSTPMCPYILVRTVDEVLNREHRFAVITILKELKDCNRIRSAMLEG